MEYNACSVFCKSNGSILCVDILGVAERLEGIGFGYFAEYLTSYKFKCGVYRVGNSVTGVRGGCAGSCRIVRIVGCYKFFAVSIVFGEVFEVIGSYSAEECFSGSFADGYCSDAVYFIVCHFYYDPAGDSAAIAAVARRTDEIVAIVHFVSSFYFAVIEGRGFICRMVFIVDYFFYLAIGVYFTQNSVQLFFWRNREETVADG